MLRLEAQISFVTTVLSSPQSYATALSAVRIAPMRSNNFQRSPFLSKPFTERLKATIPISHGLAAEIEDELHYIRRLWPSDARAFLDHLLRLDVESRHDRFAMGVSDEFIHRYAEHCFVAEGMIFGYFAEDELRGAGELRMTSPDC